MVHVMNPKDRQKDILNLLRALNREKNVKELSTELKVSELTIRRDLNELVKYGDIIRTHGGCIAAGNGLISTFFLKQFERNVELKKAIGKESAKLVKTGDTVLLGDGTTTFQFSSYINCDGPITIYTNSIPAIQELKKSPNIHLYILGGKYDLDYDMLLLKGSLSDRMLETRHFDLVIVGADAVNRDGFCLANTEEAARTTQIILRRGGRKILLADHTKLDVQGHVGFGQLSDFDLWITSTGIDKKQMDFFKKQTAIIEIKIIN